MKNYFIMTKCMFPLSKPKKIFHDIYFDNPRNITEIKKVAEVLKKANYIYPTFPENYNQVNKDYVSLEYIRDCFYDTYKEIDDVKCRKEENHYKNIYYHLARNWIIVRIGNYFSIDDNISVDNISVPSGKIIRVFSNEHFAEYEKAVEFINLLTFISFENDNYLDHSFLLSDSLNIIHMDYENKLLKNTFFDLLVISTNNSHYIEKTNEFRYFSFDLIYSRLKQNEHLLIDDWENEIILYISKNLEIYRQLTDDKMKIVSLVSMLELLIAHNPNSSRYNVEDSIRRQFSNKIMIILYLNSLVKEPDNLEKLLLFIYDLRSCIAHGNFNEISSSCKKIYQWLLNNDKNFTTNNSKFDEKSVLDYINLLLRKYFRVVLRHYLSDKKLFQILKK